MAERQTVRRQSAKNRCSCKAGTALALVVAAVCASAQSSVPAPSQAITRAGEQASVVGPADFFTGRVRVDPVWPADAHINASGA